MSWRGSPARPTSAIAACPSREICPRAPRFCRTGHAPDVVLAAGRGERAGDDRAICGFAQGVVVRCVEDEHVLLGAVAGEALFEQLRGAGGLRAVDPVVGRSERALQRRVGGGAGDQHERPHAEHEAPAAGDHRSPAIGGGRAHGGLLTDPEDEGEAVLDVEQSLSGEDTRGV